MTVGPEGSSPIRRSEGMLFIDPSHRIIALVTEEGMEPIVSIQSGPTEE